MKTTEKIRCIRQIRNYSQEYMASRLKIDCSSYSRIERGACQITIERLESIAKIFNMSTLELLAYGEVPRPEIDVKNNSYQKHLENEIEFLRSILFEKDRLLAGFLKSDSMLPRGKALRKS